MPADSEPRGSAATGVTSSRHGVISPGGFVVGHPKGLFLVAGVEFWERFSYYGMTGLLVLYLASTTATGGLNWDPAAAVRFYGFYAGCAFAAPALGGWLSSRFFGERFCILWGGVAVATGHVLLAGPIAFPELLYYLSGVDVHGVLQASGAVLGKWSPAEADAAMVADALRRDTLPGGSSAAAFDIVMIGYKLAAWSFHLGLFLILVGTGFIKPTVSSIVSRFYPANPVAREAGFAIFMTAIYVGALCANFSAGTLGERVGWHYGFTATAVGMVVGLTAYLLRQQAWLGDLGRLPDRARAEQRGRLTPGEQRRIAALLIMGAGTVVYAAAFYQKGGLLNLVTLQYVDRSIAGFEVPATWFLSISTAAFVILAPLSIRFWEYLEARGRHLSPDRKLALGLAAIGLGYVVIAGGSMLLAANPDGKLGMGWMVVTYLFFAVGDVLIWPPQIAAVAALAPERFRSMAIGTWYLTIGFGTWLTGLIGGIAYSVDLQTALWLLCGICTTGALSIAMLHRVIAELSGPVRTSSNRH